MLNILVVCLVVASVSSASLNADELTRDRRATVDRKWPGAQIPYVIVGNFSVSERATIAKAMETYRTLTCVRFVPRTTQVDYLSIESNWTECTSKVGRVGGKQILKLGNMGKSTCATDHIALHEMMHAIGFNHEQTRADRDDWITIVPENILPEQLAYFNKDPPTNNFGVAYDFASVVHSALDKYAIIKGLQTMIPKVPLNFSVGQKTELSQGDIQRVKALNNCP